MASPVATISLGRQPLVATVSVLVAFTLFHLVAFGAASRRYQKALANAKSSGLVPGSADAAPELPPRVNALVVANGMASAVAEQRGGSGVLASDVMADVTALAARHGMDLVFSEPGPITQTPSSVEIHAHFRFSCGFAQFIAFLNDLATGDRLMSLERFNLVGRENGEMELELWMSRLVLKQGAVRK